MPNQIGERAVNKFVDEHKIADEDGIFHGTGGTLYDAITNWRNTSAANRAINNAFTVSDFFAGAGAAFLFETIG